MTRSNLSQIGSARPPENRIELTSHHDAAPAVRCFITVFTTNKGTTIAKARAMGLDEVEQMIRRDPPKLSKDNLRLLKFAKFGDRKTERGSLRHNANVLTITGIEGDCDDDKTPMQWAVNRLRAAGIQSLLYTSPSHEPGGAGRWRVLCPLAAAIKDELDKQHRYWVGVLNAYLGGVLGKESFTLSQSYYFGRIIGRPDPEIVRLDGRCIDELPDHPEPNYGPNGAGNGADHHHDAASGSDGERLTESELTATLANIGADDYHRWIGVGGSNGRRKARSSKMKGNVEPNGEHSTAWVSRPGPSFIGLAVMCQSRHPKKTSSMSLSKLQMMMWMMLTMTFWTPNHRAKPKRGTRSRS